MIKYCSSSAYNRLWALSLNKPPQPTTVKSHFTYKIIDTRTNEIMCKKILKAIDNPTFKDQKQAINEFQILYSTHHPCICQGYGMNPSETIPGYADDNNMTTISLFLEYIDHNLKDVK